MENLRAFKVTTLPATDTKPVRVKIQDIRYQDQVIISYLASSPSTEQELIIWYLKGLGIDILSQAWAENKQGQSLYTIYLTKNFTSKLS